MGADEALELIGSLVSTQIGKPLDNLQRCLISKLWQQSRVKYLEIAIENGYSEAYVKDIAAQLWQILSQALEKKVNKNNFQSLIEEYGRSQPFSYPRASSLESDGSQQVTVDLDFVGREGAIEDIDKLVNRGKKVILIHQRGGEGKTTLAKQYLKRQFGDKVLEFRIAKESKDITSVESLLEERLRQMGEEPGREFGISLDRLKQNLKIGQLGVLIDNLETALDKNGRFIEPHRQYVELLLVLCDPDVLSVTLITSRDILCEPSVQIELYRPQALNINAWQCFFQNQSIQLQEDSQTLTAIHKAYGGNAKAMTLIRGAVQEDFEGNIDAYWREIDGNLLVNGELRNLVAEQFSHLSKQNPTAYSLLVRMSCYRYQDVSNVSKEGLYSLLWDVNDKYYQQIIQSLRNRALIEFRNGNYWLHSEIRAKAIEELRRRKDWERTNREAANFWLRSFQTVETVEDALKAFEAFHHFIEIEDFIQAAKVILETRSNDSSGLEHLGYACWRLGLFQPIISAIDLLEGKVNDPYILSSFNRILGYAQNLLGNISSAIKYHEKSGRIALQYLDQVPEGNDPTTVDNYRLKIKDMVNAHLINIGLAKLDLWELEEALSYFQEGLNLSSSISFSWNRIWVEDIACLALIKSYLGFSDDAHTLAAEAISAYMLPTTVISRWGKAYCPLLLGKTYKKLNELDKSFEMYWLTIDYAETCSYTQAKANAMSGLGGLYRERRDFSEALLHHLKAVEILEKLGVKFDLADAYFQLALTYQVIGEGKKSRESANEAIRLYNSMQAPKQIERVRKAVENAEA